ncbi:MAG: hypothetical protein GEU71_18705 [Actinobacteria bacterium]|nr:hypothetical protein [Actinomycetota bacterium]
MTTKKQRRNLHKPPEVGRPKRVHGSRQRMVRVNVPDEVWARFRARALEQNVSAADYVGWLLERLDLEARKRR